MSDEAAFLDALKANPADDTTRLVYADWLDEHDEPAKAEYLRASVELARTLCEPTSDTAPLLGRIEVLGTAIPVDWRLSTAARFALVFESYEPTRKIDAIKIVREMTGMGLGEAKSFVERAPSGFLYRVTPEAADSLVRYFGPGRLSISADIASVATREPTATTFNVDARLYSNVWDVGQIPTEAVVAFRAYLAKVGVPEELDLNDDDYPHVVTLGTGFSYSQAQEAIARWQALLPPTDAESEWMILVLPSLRLHTS